MVKFFFHSLVLTLLIFVCPHLAFVASFSKLSSSEKNKIYRFVTKKLPSNDLQILKNASHPYQLKEIQDDMQDTLLHYAVDKNLSSVIPLLQNNGIDIDSPTSAGITPLQIAIFNENFPMVQYLLQRGANIDKKNNNGQTPIMVATHINNREIIDELIQRGANLKLQDNNGFNILTRAVSDQNKELIDLYIEKKVPVNARTSFNRTALHFAVQNNDYDTVKKLIEAGAYVNARDYDIQTPNTPLDVLDRQKSPISISNNNSKIRKLLIEHSAKKAEPYYQNNFSLSAVYLFTSPFTKEALGLDVKTPVQVQYSGLNLRYYIRPDLSLSWTYAYGVSLDQRNIGIFMAPGGLLGLQSLFSFLQTDYDTQLHGPAQGLYYTLLGLSSLLPEGISWDIQMASVPYMSFSIEVDWARVHYIFPYHNNNPFSVQLTAELQGRMNLLFAEHFLMGINLNVGFSYTQLEFVWGLGFTIGALF